MPVSFQLVDVLPGQQSAELQSGELEPDAPAHGASSVEACDAAAVGPSAQPADDAPPAAAANADAQLLNHCQHAAGQASLQAPCAELDPVPLPGGSAARAAPVHVAAGDAAAAAGGQPDASAHASMNSQTAAAMLASQVNAQQEQRRQAYDDAQVALALAQSEGAENAQGGACDLTCSTPGAHVAAQNGLADRGGAAAPAPTRSTRRVGRQAPTADAPQPSAAAASGKRGRVKAEAAAAPAGTRARSTRAKAATNYSDSIDPAELQVEHSEEQGTIDKYAKEHKLSMAAKAPEQQGQLVCALAVDVDAIQQRHRDRRRGLVRLVRPLCCAPYCMHLLLGLLSKWLCMYDSLQRRSNGRIIEIV